MYLCGVVIVILMTTSVIKWKILFLGINLVEIKSYSLAYMLDSIFLHLIFIFVLFTLFILEPAGLNNSFAFLSYHQSFLGFLSISVQFTIFVFILSVFPISTVVLSTWTLE